MRTTCELLMTLLRENSGQDLIEYALICAFIALGCVAATNTLSSRIASQFSSVGNTLSSLSSGSGSGTGSSGSSGSSGSGSSGSSSKKKKKG